MEFFVAGGLAGATSRTVVSPLERLKIIMYGSPSAFNRAARPEAAMLIAFALPAALVLQAGPELADGPDVQGRLAEPQEDVGRGGLARVHAGQRDQRPAHYACVPRRCARSLVACSRLCELTLISRW